MVVVEVYLPVFVGLIAVAFVLGYLVPRPVRAVPVAAPAPPTPSVVPVERRRKVTGKHVILFHTDSEQHASLYHGSDERDARIAWESIALAHPVPIGRLEWWRPDGTLRGELGNVEHGA